MAITDSCMVCFLVRLFFSHCVPAGRKSTSTPDSRCANDYRAVRTVQVALQTVTAVAIAASWLVVGSGGLYVVVEWIPGHDNSISVCTLIISLDNMFAFFVSYGLGGKTYEYHRGISRRKFGVCLVIGCS